MKYFPIQFLRNDSCEGKRVFLRADLNIPLRAGTIADDMRLKKIIPTVRYLLQQQAKIIVATHIGRPIHHGRVAPIDPNFSTRAIGTWFSQNSFAVDYEPDLMRAIEKSHQQLDQLLIIENLRFFREEQETNDSFAQTLRELADIYVNDAFGSLHRNDTSIALLPTLFQPSDRYVGLLIQKELEHLMPLRQAPAHPFVVILGGNKVTEKLRSLHALIGQNRIDVCLVGGLTALPLCAARGMPVAASLVNQQDIVLARAILDGARSHTVEIITPSDFLLAHNQITTIVTDLSHGDAPVDVGPATIASFTNYLSTGQTIFMNGPLGTYEKPQGAVGTKAILQAMAKSRGYTVIGGGNTLHAAHAAQVLQQLGHASTGGGSLLAFLAAADPWNDLPGLAALRQSTTL